MRGLLLAPLALAIALAGCITSSTPVTEPLAPAALPGLALGYALEGCSEQASIFPVPMEFAAGLPEGFAPVSTDPLGATATIFATGYACPTLRPAAEGSEPVGEVAEFLGFVMVEPSEAYRAEGVDFYGVWYGVLTSSEDTAAAYRAWQVPYVAVGDVTIEGLVDTPAGRGGHILAMDANGTEHVYSAIVGEVVQGNAGKLRLFSVVEGEVVHIQEYSWNESSTIETGNSLYRYESAEPTMPPLVTAGFGFHAWGESYGWSAVPVPLPEVAAPAADAPASVPLAKVPVLGARLG